MEKNICNENNFSVLNRKNHIETLSSKTFDILIFGGGITGAGIALDAVSRGLSVALIEKKDFASGTSGKSTKLIHGGLRYLKKMQFKFVSQLGSERRILRQNSQNNVIPTPVVFPIYKNERLSKIYTYPMLRFYDLLASTPKEFKTVKVTKEELTERYPDLQSKNLKHGFVYYEYKTKDARLVIETIKKSAKLGAVCLNYAQPMQILNDGEKLTGASIYDHITKAQFDVKAKLVINATGVWCAEFAKGFDLKISADLLPTKGIHIVLSKERLPIKETFYIQASDRRMLFVVPRTNFVYVGTTDTKYSHNYREPKVDDEEIQYLLSAVNKKFPSLNLTEVDVVSTWASVRPLIKKNEKRTSEISRKDELFLGSYGLLTIAGGKLTGYRLMAKKVVDNAFAFLQKDFKPCVTKSMPLSGNISDKPLTTMQIVETADYAYDEAKQTGVSVAMFKQLFYRYGKNISLITEKAYEYKNENLTVEQCWIKAELWYAVNYEMLAKASDFIKHRTEMLWFEQDALKNNLSFITEQLEVLLDNNKLSEGDK